VTNDAAEAYRKTFFKDTVSIMILNVCERGMGSSAHLGQVVTQDEAATALFLKNSETDRAASAPV